MERDYFMTAAEAAHHGIIDTVIAHRIGSQQPAPAGLGQTARLKQGRPGQPSSSTGSRLQAVRSAHG